MLKTFDDFCPNCNRVCCSTNRTSRPTRTIEYGVDRTNNYFSTPIVEAHQSYGTNKISGTHVCAHMTDNCRCEVHSNRPVACRLYPFAPAVGGVTLSLDCPYGLYLAEVLADPTNKDRPDAVGQAEDALRFILSHLSIEEIETWSEEIADAYDLHAVFKIKF